MDNNRVLRMQIEVHYQFVYLKDWRHTECEYLNYILTIPKKVSPSKTYILFL